MTEKQRDLGRLISIGAVILVLLFAALSSCTPFLYRNNQIQVTHVLALTENGDTVKVAINDIRPTQVYNVIGYDYVRGYMNPYYDPWRRYNLYDNQYRYRSGQVSVFNSIPNWKAPSVISNQSTSGPINSGIITTGGGGAPVAVNPVTATGGGKKNN